MIISEAQIRRIMPKAKNENVVAFVKAFNKYSDMFEINTKLRTVYFLAQIAHESGELNHTEENLNYSADALLRVFPKYFTKETAAQYARQPEKIANRVYANRMGNGDEASGDGWRYRGRGLVQLTGKQNVKAYMNSGYCNGNIIEHPEWLAEYPGALKSAMWYWKANSLNRIADQDDGSKIKEEAVVKQITMRINGGNNGLASRAYYTRVAKRVLCV